MDNAIIIPSYEPDEKMVNTIKELIKSGFTRIIVVNDGSSHECDIYFQLVAEFKEVTLISHEVNKGKGCAIKTGIEYVMDNIPDCGGVITVDADGQHLPKDIRKCLDVMEKNKDFIILGVRDFNDDKVPARSRFGNKLTSFVFRLCGLKITDTQTGLRAIPGKYLRLMLTIPGERYEYETQQLLSIHSSRIPIMEVVIDTVYIDDNESSHFNPVKDSIKIYKVIISYMFRKGGTGFEWIKYLLSSLSSFFVDVILFTLINILLAGNLANDAARIFAATAGARIVSSLYNYCMNRQFVFESKASKGGSLLKYYLLAVIQAAASSGCVYILADVIFNTSVGLVQTLIKILVDVCLFGISFFVQKKWVFR